MVKMNKEYSDAFGFRLLGNFTAFMAEYPDKGGQIQSICDEDFKATCIKCYPIILSTGIDPSKYSPAVAAASASIRSTLREMFPLKEEVVDLETESEEEEEESKPSPKPKPKMCFTKKKEPLLKTVVLSCSKCSQLSTINNNLLKDLEISTQNEKKLLFENNNLRKVLQEKSLALKLAKEEYNKLFQETRIIREDPSYSDILQYFEYLNKRKRTQ